MYSQSTEETSDYRQVVKSTSLFGGVQLIILLASLIKTKLIAVLLGTAGIGIISLFNTIINLISNTSNLGVASSAVRDIAEAYSYKDENRLNKSINRVRSWSFITAAVGTLLCVALSFHLSLWTFGSGQYTFSFLFLSPIIGCMAISGGELAILKGMRKLRYVALISIYGTIFSLCISIPLYVFYGLEGIVPSLSLSSFLVTFTTLFYSTKEIPFQWNKTIHFKEVLSSGCPMIKIGISMIFAGILASISEYLVRAYLLREGTMEVVGLYNAGYTIIVMYMGMIFTAMSTDYFPRLSAVQAELKRMNTLVNQQIEIAVLIIAPSLLILLMFLPYIIQLLYSSRFLPIIMMIQYGSISIFIKSISYPIGYTILAKGNSTIFIVQEVISFFYFLIFIFIGYYYWELIGIGIALSLSAFCDLMQVYIIAHIKYKFSISKKVKNILFCQFLPITLGYSILWIEKTTCFWLIGIIVISISSSISLFILNKRISLKGLLNKCNVPFFYYKNKK